MEEMSSEPTVAKEQPWYRTWWRVYFSPLVQTYQFLAQSRNATLSRSRTWVVMTAAVISFLPLGWYLLNNGLYIPKDLSTIFSNPTLDINFSFYLVRAFRTVFLAFLIFQVSTSVINWLARKLGGNAESDAFGFLLVVCHE
jgi:hypothetical protein